MKIRLRENTSTQKQVQDYYDYLEELESDNELDDSIFSLLQSKFPDCEFILGNEDFDYIANDRSDTYIYLDKSYIRNKYERNSIYLGIEAGDSLYFITKDIKSKIISELFEENLEKKLELDKNYELLKSLVKELTDILDKNNIEYSENESRSTFSFYVTIYPENKDTIKVRFSDHQESVNRERKSDYSIEVSKLDYDWGKSKFKQYSSEDTLQDVYDYLDLI